MNRFRFIQSTRNGWLFCIVTLGLLTIFPPTLLAASTSPSDSRTSIITAEELAASHTKIMHSEQLLKLKNYRGQQLVKSIDKISISNELFE